MPSIRARSGVTDAKQFGDRQTSEGRPHAWSLDKLTDACQHKHITCQESDAFTNLRGVVATCGETSIICLRAEMPEGEKVFAFAHELGHIALGHTQVSGTVEHMFNLEGALSLLDKDEEKEQEASVWAARLLVDPEVYDQCSRDLATEDSDRGQTIDRAFALVSERLNIPKEVVQIWFDHRDDSLPVDPRVWLEQA